MSRHDDTVRLHHMLDHAREAVQIASGRSRPDLDSDRQFALAMTLLLVHLIPSLLVQPGRRS